MASNIPNRGRSKTTSGSDSRDELCHHPEQDRSGQINTSLKVKNGVHLAQEIKQFREIYLDSFPPSERIEFETLVRTISQRERWFYGAYWGQKLVGFAVVLPLDSNDIYLLEYLAVDKELRGQGIGSFLLREVTHRLSEKNALGLVLEVEAIRQSVGENEKLRKRRISFYRRNGAEIVECAPNYRAPNLADGGSIDMRLMWLPLNMQRLDGVRLRNCIRDIFVQSYGRSEDDPLLITNLRQLVC